MMDSKNLMKCFIDPELYSQVELAFAIKDLQIFLAEFREMETILGKGCISEEFLMNEIKYLEKVSKNNSERKNII